MKLTQKLKDQVKAYRIWCVMRAEDAMRAEWEVIRQDAIDVHNEHVRMFHARNYQVCANAAAEKAQELGLYA